METEKIVSKKIDVPVIEGSEPIAIATVCVNEKGDGAIAFSALKGVDIMKIGNSLIDFGNQLLGDHAAAKRGGGANGKA